MKLQRGYLLIVAVILIVIIGAIGSFLAYMFIGSTRSSTNVLQSKQAFYLATSGLELAKRDILANSAACTSISGVTKYTNASLTGVNGQYTVTGSINNVSSTLAGGLSVNATSIPLNGVTVASSALAGGISASSTALSVVDGSAFPADGTVKIGGEYIGYSSKSGNVLPNLVRGIAGTTVASHSAGSSTTSGFFDSGAVSIDSELIAYNGISGSTLQNTTRGVGGTTATGHGNGKTVTQNQCILTATAGVPTLSNPNALRVVQDVLPVIGGSSSFLTAPGGYIPGIVSVRKPRLNSNAIVRNTEVNSSPATERVGSTIVTAANGVNFTSNARTEIFSPVQTGSDKNNTAADVVRNSIDITGTKLSDHYFGVGYDVSTQPAGTTAYSSNPYTGGNTTYPGGVSVWIDRPVTLNSNTVVGSPGNPVLLITTGNFTMNSNTRFYGLVYAAGKITLNSNSRVEGFLYANTGNIKLNSNAIVNGAVATTKRVVMNSNARVVYDSNALDGLSAPGSSTSGAFVGSISPQERFK